MIERVFQFTILILFSLQIFAATSWQKDLSFDHLDIWKNGDKRLSVEVKKQKNKIQKYDKEKVENYLEKRNKILKYADFSNFITESLKVDRSYKKVKIESSGTYTNSRNAKIFYKELHTLFPNKTMVLMITSPTELTKEDLDEFDKKVKFIQGSNK